MPQLPYPILVVSYVNETREALVHSLEANDIVTVSCSSFSEAENKALQGIFSGMVVDLPSMIKAKGEEKIVACSLAGFYPTLRVRAAGLTLDPVTTPDGSMQAPILSDFIKKTCSSFTPRRLRTSQRHSLCVSTLLIHGSVEKRSFTMNISWGGAFIVDPEADRFRQGDVIELCIPELESSAKAEVCWIQPWGIRLMPGMGVRFLSVEAGFEKALSSILKTAKGKDRDRLVK